MPAWRGSSAAFRSEPGDIVPIGRIFGKYGDQFAARDKGGQR